MALSPIFLHFLAKKKIKWTSYPWPPAKQVGKFCCLCRLSTMCPSEASSCWVGYLALSGIGGGLSIGICYYISNFFEAIRSDLNIKLLSSSGSEERFEFRGGHLSISGFLPGEWIHGREAITILPHYLEHQHRQLTFPLCGSSYFN